jgi:zinc protease
LIASLFSPENLSMSVLLPEGTALADLLPKEATPSRRGRDAKPQNDSVDAWESWLQTVLADNWIAPAREEGADAGTSATGQAETIDLGNGRTLVLIPDNTLPYTAMNLVYAGGDTLLTEKDQGLASFTASLLTKGTGNRSATAIEDFLSDRAASFSAAAGRQTFGISINAPARFTDDMFTLLGDTLRSAAFSDEEAERVRDNQISAITIREDQPTGLAFRRIFPFLFRNHPYGFLQLGEKDRVAQFTAGEAREFWKNQSQRPWVLAVAGVFDRDAILAAAKQLPAPTQKGVTPGLPQWNSERLLNLSLPGRNQSHLFMIFPTVGFGAADEPGLELLQNILAGQSGLLFRDLRDEHGLAYSVTAIPWRAEKAGAIIFYIGTEPDKMQQAEEGFLRVIEELREHVLPQDELKRGNNRMTGNYFRSHQTLTARSSEAATLTTLRRPLGATRQLLEQARGVDAEALRELARTYLDPDKAFIVKVEP